MIKDLDKSLRELERLTKALNKSGNYTRVAYLSLNDSLTEPIGIYRVVIVRKSELKYIGYDEGEHLYAMAGEPVAFPDLLPDHFETVLERIDVAKVKMRLGVSK